MKLKIALFKTAKIFYDIQQIPDAKVVG